MPKRIPFAEVVRQIVPDDQPMPMLKPKPTPVIAPSAPPRGERTGGGRGQQRPCRRSRQPVVFVGLNRPVAIDHPRQMPTVWGRQQPKVNAPDSGYGVDPCGPMAGLDRAYGFREASMIRPRRVRYM